jgi:putative methionine-R-sulfoxide reductase with GAF domain
MKRIFSKLKLPIVSVTLFVSGIIISAGGLYVHHANPGMVTFRQVTANVGWTFFMGLISIFFTTRSVRQTVVYLERKKDQDQRSENADGSDHQLALDPLHSILSGKQDISQKLIVELARQLQAGQVALYVAEGAKLELKLGYALSPGKTETYTCNFGEGLIGRVATEGTRLYIDKIPEGHITIFSGLGSASPTFLVIIPLRYENKTKAVLEIALFNPLTEATLAELENISNKWAAYL